MRNKIPYLPSDSLGVKFGKEACMPYCVKCLLGTSRKATNAFFLRSRIELIASCKMNAVWEELIGLV